MEKKKVLSTVEQLVDARKNALQDQLHGKLTPHGKLWGMDVFSWREPDFEVLQTTVTSFPFPVFMLGNKDFFQKVSTKTAEEDWWNIEGVIAHDNPQFVLRSKYPGVVQTVVGTASIADAMKMMEGLSKKNNILLFTISGGEHERESKEFKTILELYQS